MTKPIIVVLLLPGFLSISGYAKDAADERLGFVHFTVVDEFGGYEIVAD